MTEKTKESLCLTFNHINTRRIWPRSKLGKDRPKNREISRLFSRTNIIPQKFGVTNLPYFLSERSKVF